MAIPDWAIIAIFLLAVIAISLIPDRHRPWWERSNRIDTLMPVKSHVMQLEDAFEWPIKAIVRHFENRLFELAMTVVMLSIAVWVMIWPHSIEAGSFRYLLHVMSPWTIVGLYMLFGIARFAALIANGHWRFYGPLIRALGALLAAFVWAQMSAALYLLSTATGNPPSIGIPVYGTLALFELISMYRALARGNVGQQDP